MNVSSSHFKSALTSMLLLCIAIAWSSGIHLNTTTSMPAGFWKETETSPIRNSVVKTCVPEHMARLAKEREYLRFGLCPGGVQPVLKYIAALEGDVVEFSAAGMKVNGTLLPHTAPRNQDTRGRPLKAWPFGKYVVPPGKVWLFVPSLRSFDSRYFGPVDVRALTSMELLQRW